MDRGAWWATDHRVAKSWTQLKGLSTQHILDHLQIDLHINDNEMIRTEEKCHKITQSGMLPESLQKFLSNNNKVKLLFKI